MQKTFYKLAYNLIEAKALMILHNDTANKETANL